MKKLILAAVLAVSSLSANAVTWVGNDGQIWGNVCRNGAYFTVYPVSMGQPVGTSCPIRNGYGQIVGYGFVSNE